MNLAFDQLCGNFDFQNALELFFFKVNLGGSEKALHALKSWQQCIKSIHAVAFDFHATILEDNFPLRLWPAVCLRILSTDQSCACAHSSLLWKRHRKFSKTLPPITLSRLSYTYWTFSDTTRFCLCHVGRVTSSLARRTWSESPRCRSREFNPCPLRCERASYRRAVGYLHTA